MNSTKAIPTMPPMTIRPTRIALLQVRLIQGAVPVEQHDAAVVAQLFNWGLVVWRRTSSSLPGLNAKWCQGEVPAPSWCPNLKHTSCNRVANYLPLGVVQARLTENRQTLRSAKPLTVAWRSNLLPAKCFTSTTSFGWHHLASVSRDDLNAARGVARRSSSAKNRVRSSPLRAMNAAPA